MVVLFCVVGYFGFFSSFFVFFYSEDVEVMVAWFIVVCFFVENGDGWERILEFMVWD